MSYRFRRLFESWSGAQLKIFILLFVVGSIPPVAIALDQAVSAAAAGSAGVLAGMVSGFWTWVKSRNNGSKTTLPIGLVAVAGALLLLYGVALLSFWLAVNLIMLAVPLVPLALLGFTFVYGRFVHLNYVSVHRFYRDRLMEAFLPNPELLDQAIPAARSADKAPVQETWPADGPKSPLQLVNTNLVLVDSESRRQRLRGGDNFVLSPLYCGSNSTGWVASRIYLDSKLSLSTAMAISGAAANPNTGAGGQGTTRNRAVSMLMTMLGISLGYWVHHPNSSGRPLISRLFNSVFTPHPNHFVPETLTVLGRGFKESSPFLQLSDGGHFENLALYELFRRRLRVIVLCDGACDPNYAFEDFQVAIRRVEEDFGVKIDFDTGNHLESLMPRPRYDDQGAEILAYPPDTRFASRGYVVGTITYSNERKGLLIYIKSTMIETISLKTKGYKGAHPAFPHESTADQFFDEDQFEAYRELGYRIGREMVNKVSMTIGTVPVVGFGKLTKQIEDRQLG